GRCGIARTRAGRSETDPAGIRGKLSFSSMLAGSVYVYRRRHRRTSTSVSRDRLSPSSQQILSATAGASLTVTTARKGVTDTSRRHGENTLGTCLFACCRNDGSPWTTRRHRAALLESPS